jgi:membrane-associated phospholipid phosphatase
MNSKNTERNYPVKMLFLKSNPSLWFVLIFTFIITIIILFIDDDFSFKDTKLFTLIWTYTVLMAIHTVLNIKRFKIFIRANPAISICKSYLHVTIQYLPYLIIAVIYENLILFSRVLNNKFKNIDLLLMRIDEKIFSVQPTIWIQKFINPLAVDFFMIAYSMYFIYPFFYLIYLYQKNKLQIFHKVLLAQIIALIISLPSYIIFPAVGPRLILNPEIAPVGESLPLYSQKLEGISSSIVYQITGRESLYGAQVDLWNYIERLKTDCMPSMHACLCLICLIYALKYRKIFKHQKLAVWFWIIGVTALIISTVYLRYHWVIDVFAGAILALIVYFITEKIDKLWLSYRRKHGFDNFDVPWLTEAEKLKT